MVVSKGITLDRETADRITLLTLIDYRNYLRKELKGYAKGEWLHADDVISHQKTIEALEMIIDHFGGEVEA